MSWLVPYADLTTDQMRAVDASADTHRLIVGAPGSGKTLALLHRTARLRERYHVAPGRYRLMVFTNMLKQYIRAGATQLVCGGDLTALVIAGGAEAPGKVSRVCCFACHSTHRLDTARCQSPIQIAHRVGKLRED
jgi:hypothetical protein